ncbi:MAG: hypothetical protein J1G04_03470 [Clostridiales bacterium]|nr:hypothetical protein [Clostridiales bacterium]
MFSSVCIRANNAANNAMTENIKIKELFNTVFRYSVLLLLFFRLHDDCYFR